MDRTNVMLQANIVLETFAPWLSFVSHENKVCLQHTIKGSPYPKIVEAQVSKNSGALSINYGRLGMGGTMAMAVGQLTRWIRGQSRVPLAAWKYWAGPKILLAGTGGVLLVERITKSDYDDGRSTKCVLCGGSESGDWWSLGDLVGPCCYLGKCR